MDQHMALIERVRQEQAHCEQELVRILSALKWDVEWMTNRVRQRELLSVERMLALAQLATLVVRWNTLLQLLPSAEQGSSGSSPSKS